MSELRIIGDVIELDGVTVGALIPDIRMSTCDELVRAFDALDEVDELRDDVERLEDKNAALESRVEQLEARLNRLTSLRAVGEAKAP